MHIGRRIVHESTTTRASPRSSMQVSFGSAIKVVGTGPDLGDWDPNKGLSLTWQEGDVWTAKVDVPVGETLKFKVGGGGYIQHTVDESTGHPSGVESKCLDSDCQPSVAAAGPCHVKQQRLGAGSGPGGDGKRSCFAPVM